MARMVDVAAGVMVLVAAGTLYAVKHDTQRLERAVQARERALEKAESDIAVLKAERSYLSRPERIEILARKQGLEPIREHQYSRIEEREEDAIARLLERPVSAADTDGDDREAPTKGPEAP